MVQICILITMYWAFSFCLYVLFRDRILMQYSSCSRVTAHLIWNNLLHSNTRGTLLSATSILKGKYMYSHTLSMTFQLLFKIDALCQCWSCLLYECGSTTACFNPIIIQYNVIQLCPRQIRLWSFGLLICGWGLGFQGWGFQILGSGRALGTESHGFYNYME